MGRRIWIVPRGTKINQEVIDTAKSNNCPEIVSGIPPALENVGSWQRINQGGTADEPIYDLIFKPAVTEDILPRAYEEPESAISGSQRDWGAEIDGIKAILLKRAI